VTFGPWLFGARADLAIFGGSALFALGLVALRHGLGWDPGLPEWGFLAFILAIDVAHVYSTLFRTYLDGAELRARPLLYLLVPVLGYAASVALYTSGSLTFWSVLAYLALFHFVRQNVGWAAVYRARAGRSGLAERVVDEAALYAATLYPALVWHARLADRHFAWFVAGDFAELAWVKTVLPAAGVIYVVALGAFCARELYGLVRRRQLLLGRFVVVTTTAATWYVGIVLTNSDFDFTVTNVIVHGVPYVALLWMYARERRAVSPESVAGDVAHGGFVAFAAVLLVLAFVEELFWDRLVWHERSWLFGEGSALGENALTWLVPLLTLPQLTHYVLDGFLWRRAETRRLPAQRAALGFAELVRSPQ
jgi:hypothetical protein